MTAKYPTATKRFFEPKNLEKAIINSETFKNVTPEKR